MVKAEVRFPCPVASKYAGKELGWLFMPSEKNLLQALPAKRANSSTTSIWLAARKKCAFQN